MERIEAGLLVPGKGKPLRDGVVVWDGPTITYVGPAAGAPPAGQAPSTRAVAVLPGLWDCHGHLFGMRTQDLSRLPGNSDAVNAFRTQVIRHWRKELRRRSQRTRITWARMNRIATRWIPQTRTVHPFPQARFAATHPR